MTFAQSIEIHIFITGLFLVLIAPNVFSHDEDHPAHKVGAQHEHVCKPIVIWVTGPDGEIEKNVHHRQDHKPIEITQNNAFTDEWMRRFGGGKVKQTSPPDNGVNCHGLTFDEGKSWLDDPTPFLQNCTRVPRDQARAGDVVVYGFTDSAGKTVIKHTGRVKDVSGGSITVHSQWAEMGDFDHDIDTVPKGEKFTFSLPPNGTRIPGSVDNYGTPTVMRCP